MVMKKSIGRTLAHIDVDRHISFDFVREKLKDSHTDTGRTSIDPEVVLRILQIGYLYGVTSERKLVEEQMHLAWRWFTDSASIRRFPITPRFPRTVMERRCHQKSFSFGRKVFVSISSPLFADSSRAIESFCSGLLIRCLGSLSRGDGACRLLKLGCTDFV